VICPDCESNTRVKETRQIEEKPTWIKRRRYCPSCDKTFWTVEMPATDIEIGDENEQN
jgi:transcriptional regulator NrdR family protein